MLFFVCLVYNTLVTAFYFHKYSYDLNLLTLIKLVINSTRPFSIPIQDGGFARLKTFIFYWSWKLIVVANKRGTDFET